MSFLIECVARRATVMPRAVAVQVPRAFSTSIPYSRTTTQTVKDGLKSVDRAVSDKLVDGINAGAAVGSKLKEGVEDIKSGKTAGKAAELQGEARAKASELEGKAKGAAEQVKGKVKGAAEQAKKNL